MTTVNWIYLKVSSLSESTMSRCFHKGCIVSKLLRDVHLFAPMLGWSMPIFTNSLLASNTS